MIVHCAYSELDVDINSNDVLLLSTHEMRFCYISFVMIDGKKYIVKQKKSNCQRKLMGVVRDAVMAHFAENFINAHRVAIIPAGKAFIGKPRADWPATIHTIAPGKMIKEQKSRYTPMKIKQADTGFRRDMLSWMSEHEMLMLIVAYDTFFCNHDRHRGNLFYDGMNDSFCAIDMDSSFKYNLCALSCKNFKTMLKSRKDFFKAKEIRALIKFKELLQFLINRHNPADTVRMYDYFIKKAGLVEGAACFLPKFALEIKNNKKVIMDSYQDVKRLVKIVDTLIRKYQKNFYDGK
jgi:hypothetical protein